MTLPQKILAYGGGLIFGVALASVVYALYTLPVWLVWKFVVVPAFGAPNLAFWQMFLLVGTLVWLRTKFGRKAS